MTIAEFLKYGEIKLKKAGIGSARLDCLILLEDELNKDRGWLLANQNKEINSGTLTKLNKKLKRRATHEPLAYIRGFTEFYGQRFIVNKNVLEPRPESETMIEMLLKLPKLAVIADIGTGSGALAITAKLELPKSKIVATDVDPKCLKVARQNAQNLAAEVVFYRGDLLSALPKQSRPEIILANLPYVPRNVRLNQAAEMEPKLAIDGGSDGLEVYRRLFEQIESLEHKPKFILTESLPPQHQNLAEVTQQAGYKLTKAADLIQLFKLA